MGARVIVTARNADKGRAAVAGIVQRLGGDAQVQLVVFDLADLASVRRGADEILEQAPRLDVLVNNAGVVLTERARDGRRVRGDVRHQPPRPVPADEPAARSHPRVGAVTHRERGVDGAQHGAQGDALRRPAVDEAVPRHARLRRVEAGQHPLHAGAGPPRLAGTGVTANSLHPGTVRTGYGRGRRRPGLPGPRHQDRQAVLPLTGQGGPHVDLPGVVARRGRGQRASTSSSASRRSPAAGRRTPRRRSDCGR